MFVRKCNTLNSLLGSIVGFIFSPRYCAWGKADLCAFLGQHSYIPLAIEGKICWEREITLVHDLNLDSGWWVLVTAGMVGTHLRGTQPQQGSPWLCLSFSLVHFNIWEMWVRAGICFAKCLETGRLKMSQNKRTLVCCWYELNEVMQKTAERRKQAFLHFCGCDF